MNDLQAYIRLKDSDCSKIAAAVGLNYHDVQKVVKGVRATAHVRQAVAKHLGFSVDQLFGPRSWSHLRRLIRAEITLRVERSTAQTEEQLLAMYLPDSSRSLSRSKRAVNA